MKIDINSLEKCPGTLKEGFNSYSPSVLRHMFDGKSVSHILDYAPPANEKTAEPFIENRKRISISGVQEKVSMILDKNKLRLTKKGEQGTYILKPIPRDLKKLDEVPANEHLTMQIAEQIFKINTAKNVLIFFNDGTPAYLTRRFDVRKDGSKWGKEDFASLAGKTTETNGDAFKYDSSYQEIGELIKKYVSAYIIELERFFQVVVFNFAFSNGDAHLKNFSLIETQDSDYVLSPFYDLINTHIHVPDTSLALTGGLFEKEWRSTKYIQSGEPIGKDFITLAEQLGISTKRAKRYLEDTINANNAIDEIVERSFLDPSIKKAYILHYRTRRNKLKELS